MNCDLANCKRITLEQQDITAANSTTVSKNSTKQQEKLLPGKRAMGDRDDVVVGCYGTQPQSLEAGFDLPTDEAGEHMSMSPR